MTWDSVWEEIYSQRDWGQYPPGELVRFVARNYCSQPDRSQTKILEIGCGPGANIWYLAREGLDAYGIDGSITAINKCRARIQKEGLEAHLEVGDLISLKNLYPSSHFDAVIDVKCLGCNKMQGVRDILDQVISVLKPNGRMFSLMAAAGSWGYGLGTEIEPGTFVDATEGPAQGMGLNHYFTLEEIQSLFAGFSQVEIEHSTRSIDNRQRELKLWVVQGVNNP